MNNEYGITEQNLLDNLPSVIKNDENLFALSVAIARALVQKYDELDYLLIYRNIDIMPEAMLDILAKDFKIDWWSGDYTLQEKRNTLKTSWKVHSKVGTKAAVEEAVSAIYEDSYVREWFEYDGTPYHFVLIINADVEELDPEKYQSVVEKVNYYKNLRSFLDSVQFVKNVGDSTNHIFTGVASEYMHDYGYAE